MDRGVASVVHLDTHVVAWLYAGDLARIPAPALRVVESADLAISPMVGLELAYLVEIGRLTVPAEAIVADLGSRLGLRLDATPFPAVAAAASGLSWTRDPFDRLIAAQASVGADTLLTADEAIRANVAIARWE